MKKSPRLFCWLHSIVPLLFLVATANGQETPSTQQRPQPPVNTTRLEAQVSTHWVINTTSQARLSVQIVTAKGQPAAKNPTLVMIPGGNGDSQTFTGRRPIAAELAGARFTVICFDPDGRGQSEGKENYCGFTQQDGLAAVIRWAVTRPEVDAKQIALVSYSYGVTLASGVLARYPKLPVRFFIDWEGPADRNDTAGCDGSRGGHLRQVARCDDEEFWAEHEAAGFIGKIRVPYLRLQSERDHAQPDNTHAIHMVNLALHGGVPVVRLNDALITKPLDPKNPPAWLPEEKDREIPAYIARQAKELFKLPASPEP